MPTDLAISHLHNSGRSGAASTQHEVHVGSRHCAPPPTGAAAKSCLQTPASHDHLNQNQNQNQNQHFMVLGVKISAAFFGFEPVVQIRTVLKTFCVLAV